jgi:DNA-binding NtrC family response regulator
MQHRVLVVDDEPQITDVLRQFLEADGYEVFTADTAESGLNILKENVIDVVISDESMPGMSGTTFLGIVRSEFPDTVRILLTGLTDFDTALNAINIGEIYRFFTKPCNFKELRVTLKQAIQQKELLGETRRLLVAYKQQAALLRRLENKFPGMTKIDKTRTGSIIIDGANDDFDTFFEDLKREVAKAEGRDKENPAPSPPSKIHSL